MNSGLLIIGATARAAAFSAIRSGFKPWAIDQFGDADLRRLAETAVMSHYPRDAIELARRLPDAPWLYTGGLENYPRVIEQLAGQRRLLGNPAATLRRVRDLERLQDSLARGNFEMPETRRDPIGLPLDGSWLLKRTRSAGGLHILPWDATRTQGGVPCGWRLQRRIEGTPIGAVFVGANRAARWLGATRSLPAGDAARTSFAYGGSIGLVPLDDHLEVKLRRLGDWLAREFDLVGLFGVDAIVAGERIWVLEVNPRYTAGVEVLERALGIDTIGLHVAACRDGKLSAEANPVVEALSPQHSAVSQSCGKLVVYARDELHVDVELSQRWLKESPIGQWPTIADIPSPGTVVHAGQPIATVFAEASSLDEVEQLLNQRRRILLAMLPAPAR